MSELERALEWIISQQNPDGSINSKPKGFKYSEITGYFIKTALLYNQIPEAIKAANYLVSLNKNGFVSWNGVDDLAYTFDTMICADGLLDLFDYSFEDKYYNAAWQMASRIDAQNDGDIPTMSNLAGKFWNEEMTYYRVPGALYLKLIPIFQRFNMDTTHLEAMMSLQRDDGAFHCNSMSRYVFSHFHCYALDGIEKMFPQKYAKGAKWALYNLMPDGRLPAWSSDRSWSMPGANIQAAHHLYKAGYQLQGRALYNTALEDQLPNGAIPIRTHGDAETWPTIFLLLFSLQ